VNGGYDQRLARMLHRLIFVLVDFLGGTGAVGLLTFYAFSTLSARNPPHPQAVKRLLELAGSGGRLRVKESLTKFECR